MLVLEFDKNAEIEVLLDEDHKKLVVLSDSPCVLKNDNHVLLNAGLINDTEQGNIEGLYESEVKPLRIIGEGKLNHDSNFPQATPIKDQIKNLTSPFSNIKNYEGYSKIFSELDQGKFLLKRSAIKNGVLSHFADDDEPNLGKLYAMNAAASPYSNHLMTPMSNFGQDQGIEDAPIFAPASAYKLKYDFGTPLSKNNLNQA